MSTAEVDPEATLVFEHRVALSGCHGARLALAGDGGYLCVACDQPCQRVLSDPVEVTAHG